MGTIKLSDIGDRMNMSIDDIIDYCLDNSISVIINDYGVGVEYSLDDLYIVWEVLKKL
jgi:hypothetical protein